MHIAQKCIQSVIDNTVPVLHHTHTHFVCVCVCVCVSQDTVKSGGVFLYACTTGKDSCYCLHVYSQCNVCIQLGERERDRERERERETILHIQERRKEGESVKIKHIHVLTLF